jgi:hypothetical protein
MNLNQSAAIKPMTRPVPSFGWALPHVTGVSSIAFRQGGLRVF